MGISPQRVAVALVFGGMVTGGLYLTQQANGRPLPIAVRPADPPRPVRVEASPAVLPMPAPRRIVFRQTTPGEVVMTLQGDELVVQFVAAPAKASVQVADVPPEKRHAKPSAHPPRMATPVATP